jgi:hypothetical protein
MTIDWPSVERSLMGGAWVDSQATEHINMLCDSIGVRWAGTEGERKAAEYVQARFEAYGLENPTIEEFDLKTWESSFSSISIVGEGDRSIDVRPSLFCPSISVESPLIDVGFGMPHEIEPLKDDLSGSIVLISSGLEPFSVPEALSASLERIAEMGAVAAITPHPSGGRHTNHGFAGDKLDEDYNIVPMPLVHTSREDGALLARRAAIGVKIRMQVDSHPVTATSRNVFADISGTRWPDESLILGAHHDSTVDSPGANDNGSGTTVLLETARLLAKANREQGVSPGRTIRFVTFGAEEQGKQGSRAYVDRHYGPDAKPRMMINLDELAAGPMKGVALQFPELRPLVQKSLDAMREGLKCHVMAQLDASGDMYPFARKGIQSSMLWRWRFADRHPDVAFGHSSSDTIDKVRIRELKEYAGLLSRLLLRLSHVQPGEWPQNSLDVDEIEKRIKRLRGSVFRTA